MADRKFTLAEAQDLLPVLESLLRKAMQGKSLVEAVDAELQELAGRIFHLGGARVDIVSLARRKAGREQALKSVKECLAEIQATGVQVKDLDMGLLDFPSLVGDKEILLCWKLGEEKIAHWHGTDEGYIFRKPIVGTIATPPDDQTH